ncbi:hypothetical protein QAD02_020982 [Eretmocerus hayati]|uniref:Uncharacterized protein n=1 Tax=Eretmocerus hayati TaxID=131215 RepID=A0ACC2PRH3_9HYME|nr:hypothetical protein QAD02_020982 [Eretmocerus hayati]
MQSFPLPQILFTMNSNLLKKKNPRRRYRVEWEALPECRGWLTRDPQDEDRAFCPWCNISLPPKKYAVTRHGKSKEHEDKNPTRPIPEKRRRSNEEEGSSNAVEETQVVPNGSDDNRLANLCEPTQDPPSDPGGETATTPSAEELNISGQSEVVSRFVVVPNSNTGNNLYDSNEETRSDELQPLSENFTPAARHQMWQDENGVSCENSTIISNQRRPSPASPQQTFENMVESDCAILQSFQEDMFGVSVVDGVTTSPNTSNVDPRFGFNIPPYLRRNMIQPSQEKQFEEWLQFTDEEETMAKCTICQEEMQAHYNTLLYHDTCTKHLIASGKLDPCDNLNHPKSMSEIKFTAFIVGHRLAYLFLDTLIPFLKRTIFDSDVMDEVSVGRHKGVNIACNVIAPSHHEKVAQDLRENKFFMEIDESTTKNGMKVLGMVMRYLDKIRGRIRDVLWEFVNIFDSDENQKADTDTIVEKLIAPLRRNNIPFKNWLGLGLDTCPLMVSVRKSVSVEMRRQCDPGIRPLPCAAHLQDCVARML